MFDNKDKIKIALPSKGRLRKDLDALFVSKNIMMFLDTNKASKSFLKRPLLGRAILILSLLSNIC